MNEHCTDCPWFDKEKQTCCRKPPRFCDAETLGTPQPTPEVVEMAPTRADPPVR